MNFGYDGAKIRALREEAGHTKARLARLARVSGETIAKLERDGDGKAEARVLEDLARALETPVEEISPDYVPAVPPFLTTVSYDRHALINARQSKGWSVQELAERAGISFQHVYSLEAGRIKKTKPATIHHLAGALGVKPQELAPSLRYVPGPGEREAHVEAGMSFKYPHELNA